MLPAISPPYAILLGRGPLFQGDDAENEPGQSMNKGGMDMTTPIPFTAYSASQINDIEPLQRLGHEYLFGMQVVASVLPFRVNSYVIEHLIDWTNVPNDPLFQLSFPQPGMLQAHHFELMAGLLQTGHQEQIDVAAGKIRLELNPHPAEQRTLNVPTHNGIRLDGVQHKYRETVLFFPSQGQLCHTFCTFCFRWPQFVRTKGLRIAARENVQLCDYLRTRPRVTDLLITGGDPMTMRTTILARHIAPLLGPGFEHLRTIRIGTKSLTYWPYRYTHDEDADDLLRLFEQIVRSGKHLAVMAHFNHWRELDTVQCREAIRRIRDTGAVIRTQAPLLQHINNDPATWIELWKRQISLGMVPYYMFIVRDTGARHYFEVPLVRGWQVYSEAIRQVSGLARTVRGPSMSAGPGKIEVQGVATIQGEQVFVLRFLQGRNPDWVQRPFLASFDANATWLDHLQPPFGEERFFYEKEYEAMRKAGVSTG